MTQLQTLFRYHTEWFLLPCRKRILLTIWRVLRDNFTHHFRLKCGKRRKALSHRTVSSLQKSPYSIVDGAYCVWSYTVDICKTTYEAIDCIYMDCILVVFLYDKNAINVNAMNGYILSWLRIIVYIFTLVYIVFYIVYSSQLAARVTINDLLTYLLIGR